VGSSALWLGFTIPTPPFAEFFGEPLVISLSSKTHEPKFVTKIKEGASSRPDDI
jgi:hypothetical protein